MSARIYSIRGQSVMLDADLATIYGVSVAELNRAVGRQSKRFPRGSAFWLTQEELDSLAAQDEPRRFEATRAFNQDGAIALTFVLQSPEAVAASIRIVNTIVGQHDHPLAAIFGHELDDAASEAENIPDDDAAFHTLPGLVARDRHKRQSKANVRKAKNA